MNTVPISEINPRMLWRFKTIAPPIYPIPTIENTEFIRRIAVPKTVCSRMFNLQYFLK
jgi:hypothetical protein